MKITPDSKFSLLHRTAWSGQAIGIPTLHEGGCSLQPRPEGH